MESKSDLNIVILNKNEEFSPLLPNTLKELGYRAQYSAESLLQADLVFMDEASAYQWLNLLLKTKKDALQIFLPFIVVLNKDLDAERWLDLGCDDVLSKGEAQQTITKVKMLANLVNKFKFQIDKMSSTLKVLNTKIAYVDSDTGLSNMIPFLEEIKRALAISHRRSANLAILHVYLQIHDKNTFIMGSAHTDGLLQVLEERLSACVRDSDIVARLHENEFIIALLDIRKPEDAAAVSNKIIESFAKPFVKDGHENTITINIGISVFPENGSDAKVLLKEADLAMHLARAHGQNTYQYSMPPFNKQVDIQSQTSKSLRNAIVNNEFHMVYQPIVNIMDNSIVGAEGLLRWVFPNGERVLPTEIFNLAEETNQTISVTEWVLKMACRQIKIWHERELTKLKISINISRQILQEKYFSLTVSDILTKTGLSPKYLEFEISEKWLLENIDYSQLFLKQLKNLGVKIAIDSVGESYASLDYLSLFEVDFLKISKAFIHNILTDANNYARVEAIVKRANHCNIQVIAVGIETEEQLQALQKLGCHEWQGYYFSKPLHPEDFSLFLRSKR